MIKGWKRVNTLSHYHVPDGALMALIPKRNKNDQVRQVHGRSCFKHSPLPGIRCQVVCAGASKRSCDFYQQIHATDCQLITSNYICHSYENYVTCVIWKIAQWFGPLSDIVAGMVEITSGSLTTLSPIITVEEGTKVWHLVKHEDIANQARTQKVISEIFLTRLLTTKVWCV